MSSDSYTISVDNGLCNKLRACFSGLRYARANNLKFNVHWPVHPTECPAHFLDLFKSVNDINFVGEDAKFDLTRANKWIGEHGYQLNHKYQPVGIEYFAELQPNNSIMKDVHRITSTRKSYVSVHLRHGPRYVKMAKLFEQYTSPEEYIKKIPDNCDVYLATDTQDIQQLFVDHFGDRLFYNKNITQKSTRVRDDKQSVHDAVVDMYVCIKSRDFFGSNMSSFTEIIHNIRMSNMGNK